MKKIFVLFLYLQLFFSLSVNAQVNLVPNPSFENYSSCPSTLDGLELAIPWINPSWNTPDYFNVCAGIGSDPFVPYTFIGMQTPKFGQGYAGFGSFGYSANGREYIEAKLNDTLEIGKKYFVSFYISLSDSSVWAVNKVGAYFSNEFIYLNESHNLPFTPQIKNDSAIMLNDTANWMLISDTLIAQGGEKYLTIGTFEPDSMLTIDSLGWGTNYIAYYFIDDVSVICLDCPNEIASKENQERNFLVFPNPTASKFSISSSEEWDVVEVYSILGEKVFTSEGVISEVDLSEHASGMYFVRLRIGNDVFVRKLVRE